MGWPETAALAAALLAVASIAKNAIWGLVNHADNRMHAELEDADVQEQLYLLRRDVDELRDSVGPDVETVH